MMKENFVIIDQNQDKSSGRVGFLRVVAQFELDA
jgi:hypothetical protein